jgi:hypothetical protein
MNYPALIAFAILLTAAIVGATWLAARLAGRGNSTGASTWQDAQREPDYGVHRLDLVAARVERLRRERAEAMDECLTEALLSEPPPVPPERRWRTVTVPLDDYRADPLRWERMASGWTRVVIVDGRGNRYASISSDDGVRAATLKMEK